MLIFSQILNYLKKNEYKGNNIEITEFGRNLEMQRRKKNGLSVFCRDREFSVAIKIVNSMSR